MILPEVVEAELKEAVVISMGTEISDTNMYNIRDLCDQVVSLSEYRGEVYDYLKNRMNTITPNMTALVGVVVGAHLIGHGGSLMNLAKQRGSTVRIIGAEKGLFRDLKTKHATPKLQLSKKEKFADDSLQKWHWLFAMTPLQKTKITLWDWRTEPRTEEKFILKEFIGGGKSEYCM
ncbi:hypothetical protein ACFE04_021925 [Oxalis oulophora]